MPVEVTVRHVEIDKELQEYAKQKAEMLADSFPRVEYVHVIIDVEKHLQLVEVIAQAKNHLRVDASESSDQMRASIDKAFSRVERQLRKARDKVQSKRQSRAKSVDRVEDVDTVED